MKSVSLVFIIHFFNIVLCGCHCVRNSAWRLLCWCRKARNLLCCVEVSLWSVVDVSSQTCLGTLARWILLRSNMMKQSFSRIKTHELKNSCSRNAIMFHGTWIKWAQWTLLNTNNLTWLSSSLGTALREPCEAPRDYCVRQSRSYSSNSVRSDTD